jgi:hypothetical protein
MKYQAPSRVTFVATAVLALLGSLMFSYSKPVEMRVDGQSVISDVPPVTTPKGVYVPLRPVSDALGAETHYERKSGDVVVTRGDQVVHFKVGSTHARLNGMPLTLKHAPFRVRGRVMLSLHEVQQVFGVRVRFDKMTARVEVNSPGVSDAAAPQFEAQ